MRKRFNSETGRFDWVNDEFDPSTIPSYETDPVFSAWLIATPPIYIETDPLSLHLDQTTPQDIINGQPDFLAGLRAGSTNQFSIDASGNVLTTGSGTFTNIFNNGYLDMLGIAQPASPSAGTARFHAFTANGFTRFEQDNEAGTNLTLGRDDIIICKNDSGGSITKGQVVYIKGTASGVPTVGLAKANSAATMPALGFMMDTTADSGFGQVMKIGILNSIDTSAFSEGVPLYVSTTTAGSWQTARPSGLVNYVQRLGNVLSQNVTTGSIAVTIAPFVGNMETGTNAATWTGSAIVGSSITDSGLTPSLGVYTGTGGLLTTTPPTSGILGHWTRTYVPDDGQGTPEYWKLSPATSTDLLKISTIGGLGTEPSPIFPDGSATFINIERDGLTTAISMVGNLNDNNQAGAVVNQVGTTGGGTGYYRQLSVLKTMLVVDTDIADAEYANGVLYTAGQYIMDGTNFQIAQCAVTHTSSGASMYLDNFAVNWNDSYLGIAPNSGFVLDANVQITGDDLTGDNNVYGGTVTANVTVSGDQASGYNTYCAMDGGEGSEGVMKYIIAHTVGMYSTGLNVADERIGYEIYDFGGLFGSPNPTGNRVGFYYRSGSSNYVSDTNWKMWSFKNELAYSGSDTTLQGCTTKWRIGGDWVPVFFGTGQDACEYYDGTNFVINPAYAGTGYLDVRKSGTAKSTVDFLALTNLTNAADMDGTGTGLLFNQKYYHATTPVIVDSGRIAVVTETDWTSTTSTQDSYMVFMTALDGTVAERMRLTSAGNELLVGKLTTYNNVATEDYGVPAIVDGVALTGQSASIGATNFTNAGTAGLYRVNYYLEATTLNAGATSVLATFGWTDDAGATTTVSATLVLTALGRTSGIFYVRLASGSITYATTLVDATGLARYALYADCERLK